MEKRCTWDNGSLWLKDQPCKIYVGQWPIFHGPLILPYIIVRLKLFLYIKKWHRLGVFVPLRALALVINFSGILTLTVYFNISAYVAIIWLSFDKILTVLSKSQMELGSVKYSNPPCVQKYGRWPPLKFRQYLSMAAIFYGYILGKMLYFSIIMTTTGIKWWNSRNLWILIKKRFLTQNFEILIFVWNCCPHDCKCKTENPIQIWALKCEIWPFKNEV